MKGSRKIVWTDETSYNYNNKTQHTCINVIHVSHGEKLIHKTCMRANYTEQSRLHVFARQINYIQHVTYATLIGQLRLYKLNYFNDACRLT